MGECWGGLYLWENKGVAVETVALGLLSYGLWRDFSFSVVLDKGVALVS